MPLDWNDDKAWILSTEQPWHGAAPPYVGNGRIGLRLGALILGTDTAAPPLTSASQETCLNGTPHFDHSFPLQAFAAHARDGYQYVLPSWANLNLRVGRHRFQPEGLTTSSTRPITTWLDLRTGEAGLDGVWRCDNQQIQVRIRLLTPRSHPHGGFWELELRGLEEPAEIIFGLAGEHLATSLEQTYQSVDGRIIGTARTQRKGRTLGLGLAWQVTGAAITSVTTEGASAAVSLAVTGASMRLRVFHTVRGGTESWDENEIVPDLNALAIGVENGSLRTENERLWRGLWADALDVTALPLDARDQRFLLAQQFYLLASYDGSAHPTGPLGLSGNQWKGMMLWDTDLWHFGALHALWPKLARQTVRARLIMLPGARRHATSLGLPGAWFGWMCDEEGKEMAPLEYRREIHVNAWIALAVAQSAWPGEDKAWQKEVFPLLEALADAICARAEESSDGAWHFQGVLPPDESVVEDHRNPGLCDDSVSTNLAFRAALRAAIAAAQDLDRKPTHRWKEVADGLVVLPPGPDQIIPEYRGYNGHPIKQADLVLAFWPLQTDYPDDIVRANLDYYRGRVVWGPLMTEQVDACIRLRHGFGERTEVLRDFLSRYRRYVRGAFEVPYECIDNSNSLMITACGGLIQALVHGWFYSGPGKSAAVPRLLCR